MAKCRWLGIFWEMHEAINRDYERILLHRIQNPIAPEIKAAIDIHTDSLRDARGTESTDEKV